ncbi:MAG: polysaccharide deacetylase family protein [Nitrospiraceae bacterium]|nr:polysaccharide deacetylase family protein [Nitrospiraceae bacterium]
MLLSEFLGLDYRIAIGNRARDYEIVLENGNTLLIRDVFFGRRPDGAGYMARSEIPSKTGFIRSRFAPLEDIPAIYGTGELAVEKGGIVCGLDIFASSFFMLTRWEEHANPCRDPHGRFPSRESLAHRQGFLRRAVVNEYVEMLWNMLAYLKCGQARKEKTFRTFATHDVDAPFLLADTGPFAAARRMGGDFIRRKDPAKALHNLYSWAAAARHAELDPYNTFGHIMGTSERAGLKSTFLFITERRLPEFDGNYSLRHKLVRGLLADIHGRGHDIGLHLSYTAADDPGQTRKEFDTLRRVCSEEGVRQERWMSRQHFLRWETPATFNNLEVARMDYDSTLSYADSAGFRCGVCYEYPAFNVLTRTRLNLRERPLLVMECTVIDERYMGLGSGEEAFALIKSIKDTCRRFNGDFVILWHNTRLTDQAERRLYNEILQA